MDDGGNMSGGLVAIGLTFTGITIATVANLVQEQAGWGRRLCTKRAQRIPTTSPPTSKKTGACAVRRVKVGAGCIGEGQAGARKRTQGLRTAKRR